MSLSWMVDEQFAAPEVIQKGLDTSAAGSAVAVSAKTRHAVPPGGHRGKSLQCELRGCSDSRCVLARQEARTTTGERRQSATRSVIQIVLARPLADSREPSPRGRMSSHDSSCCASSRQKRNALVVVD